MGDGTTVNNICVLNKLSSTPDTNMIADEIGKTYCRNLNPSALGIVFDRTTVMGSANALGSAFADATVPSAAATTITSPANDNIVKFVTCLYTGTASSKIFNINIKTNFL